MNSVTRKWDHVPADMPASGQCRVRGGRSKHMSHEVTHNSSEKHSGVFYSAAVTAPCNRRLTLGTSLRSLKVGFPSLYDFPNPNLAMAKKLWPMALGWWLYGVSGVIALKYLNVPMFSSFRRFTTIIVMFGEYRLYGRVPPADQRNAVLVMTGGAAIAGFTDLTFSLPGYCWVLTCAVSTALYLLFISKLGRESGLNDLGLLFYNNLLALPFMGASLLLSGELPLVAAYKWLHTLDFQVFFLISAMQAFFLNFLIFLCTRVNSPLITSVTGTVKDLVTNALGMTMFGDFPFNPPNVVSIAICFLGSVW